MAEAETENKTNETLPNITCILCNKTFTLLSNMKRHLRNIHKEDTSLLTIFLHMKCPLCLEYTCSKTTDLHKHLETVHDITLDIEQKTFDNTEDFYKWKSEIETETNSLFIKKNRTVQLSNGSEKAVYDCQRSGFYRPEGAGLRALKKQGSVKMNASCPAKITMTTNCDKTIMVEFIKTHCGHLLDNSNSTGRSKLKITNKEQKQKCPLCLEFTCEKSEDLHKHLENVHDVNLETEHKSFANITEFENWKSEMEKETNSFFFKANSTKHSINIREKITYNCNRSGFYIPGGKGVRALKKQGSVKLNAICPAKIVVTNIFDKIVKVNFIKTHCGHSLDDLSHLNKGSKLKLEKKEIEDCESEILDTKTEDEIENDENSEVENDQGNENIIACFEENIQWTTEFNNNNNNNNDNNNSYYVVCSYENMEVANQVEVADISESTGFNILDELKIEKENETEDRLKNAEKLVNDVADQPMEDELSEKDAVLLESREIFEDLFSMCDTLEKAVELKKKLLALKKNSNNKQIPVEVRIPMPRKKYLTNNGKDSKHPSSTQEKKIMYDIILS